MKRAIPVLLCLFALLLTAACVPSRADRDKKLGQACEAIVNTFLLPGDQVLFQDVRFSDSKTFDNHLLRTAHLRGHLTHDKGAYHEKNYICSFEEQTNMAGWQASFYSFENNEGEIFGNKDGTITGELTKLIQLNQVVEDAVQ